MCVCELDQTSSNVWAKGEWEQERKYSNKGNMSPLKLGFHGQRGAMLITVSIATSGKRREEGGRGGERWLIWLDGFMVAQGLFDLACQQTSEHLALPAERTSQWGDRYYDWLEDNMKELRFKDTDLSNQHGLNFNQLSRDEFNASSISIWMWPASSTCLQITKSPHLEPQCGSDSGSGGRGKRERRRYWLVWQEEGSRKDGCFGGSLYHLCHFITSANFEKANLRYSSSLETAGSEFSSVQIPAVKARQFAFLCSLTTTTFIHHYVGAGAQGRAGGNSPHAKPRNNIVDAHNEEHGVEGTLKAITFDEGYMVDLHNNGRTPKPIVKSREY
ncbi:hypothetical protein DFH08DRAFT_820260 [Mycena albidolilacea]|uniref:Uncharacterized protein n=1 Tax=Mycena albidolilacea TaxID=1033008 RepID=A0AAD6ZC77_9AGAR|nr:hypothetical protein DFH08DRAFT_820260 [Mycena albidolilacea]